MPLTSFCGCASRFESYLVANPEDRFSRDEAQLKHIDQAKKQSLVLLFHMMGTICN